MAETLSDTALGEQALSPEILLRFTKASADPLRLLVLRILSRDSFGVLELSGIFSCPQSSMSHHLKILAKAGLVTTRREGNSIFYQRAYRPPVKGLKSLQQTLFATCDQLLLSAEQQQRLDGCYRERARNSEVFFRENTHKFREQQELIASYQVYGAAVAELLAASPAAAGTVLEVGPGEGLFLAELAPRFRRVVALDNSEGMLDRARDYARRQGLDNIEFLLGDTRLAALQQRPEFKALDCVVVNMVLHHVPKPADMFEDLAALVKPGGQLLVTDLCGHDQSWVKQSCGDIWLGFDPGQLEDWARASGFTPGVSHYLSQRNGFCVQVREFVRTE